MAKYFWEKVRFFFLLLIICVAVQQACSSDIIKVSGPFVLDCKEIKKNAHARVRERRKEEEVEEEQVQEPKKKERKNTRRSIDFEEELDEE